MKHAIRITILILGIMPLLTSVYAQHTKLPPFRMEQVNGKVFKAEELPYGRPIVLAYFLPDCDHCQKLTEEIIGHIHAFDKASVAMITYYPVTSVGNFARKYGLNKYSNFYLGTEVERFFLKDYYQLTSLPFMALYNKNGDLQKAYYSEKGLDDLVQRLKGL